MTGSDIFYITMDADAPEVTIALGDMYLQATPEQGQHDLRRCLFCHVEEIWHGSPRYVAGVDNLTHKPNCPVGAVRDLLEEIELFGKLIR